MKKARYSANEEIIRTILRARRVTLGYRQQDLARKLHAQQSFVSKYESGERLLTFVETIRICQVLDLDPCIVLKQYLDRHET
ncbi:MAG: helix-turn-helix transcriptional regulator [Gammaproteobacteria bacterium]|nr:helix-turn-helix transcriptional regulator [Gammaproteobacteria bacterium]